MPEYRFDRIKGYLPKKITEKHLAKWREGLSAANPASALLLVKEIDTLRAKLAKTEEALVSCEEKHRKQMKDTLYIVTEIIEASADLKQFEKSFHQEMDRYYAESTSSRSGEGV